LENSLATTQNSTARVCLFPERGLPFHNNPPVTLQSSPAIPVLHENPAPFPKQIPFYTEIGTFSAPKPQKLF